MPWLTSLIIIALILFWFWMFWDMTNNETLPLCFVSFTRGANPRMDWTVMFIVLNVITAGYYYVTVYQKRY